MGLEGETTDALLGGIRADGTAAERPRGWAAVVAPALSYRSVQRLNASTVLIDVAAPAYAIEAPEQISVVVPRAALASADANLTVYPELAIRPPPGTLELAGSLCNATERVVARCEASRYTSYSAVAGGAPPNCRDGGGEALVESVCVAQDVWLQGGTAWVVRPWKPINTSIDTFYNPTHYNSTLEMRLRNETWRGATRGGPRPPRASTRRGSFCSTSSRSRASPAASTRSSRPSSSRACCSGSTTRRCG